MRKPVNVLRVPTVQLVESCRLNSHSDNIPKEQRSYKKPCRRLDSLYCFAPENARNGANEQHDSPLLATWLQASYETVTTYRVTMQFRSLFS